MRKMCLSHLVHVVLRLTQIRTRAFVDWIQAFLRSLVNDLGVPTIESEHTGLFTSPTSKIASIGLQLQHRVTMHGFALNVEDAVKPWFNHIVACGLADVHATTLESERRERDVKPRVTVRDVIDLAVPKFGEAMERPMVQLEQEGPVWDIVADAMRRIDEDIARRESGEIS